MAHACRPSRAGARRSPVTCVLAAAVGESPALFTEHERCLQPLVWSARCNPRTKPRCLSQQHVARLPAPASRANAAAWDSLLQARLGHARLATSCCPQPVTSACLICIAFASLSHGCRIALSQAGPHAACASLSSKPELSWRCHQCSLLRRLRLPLPVAPRVRLPRS